MPRHGKRRTDARSQLGPAGFAVEDGTVTPEFAPAGLMQQPGAIVLCGGTSRRLAGRDKTRESRAGTRILDHLLDALPSGWAVVCVGEERATTRSVGWCRESPAGGGPVAGIAAGLEQLECLQARICVVVGGDMPFAAPAVPTLVAALTAGAGLDAVLAADPDGRPQPLLAATAARRCGPRSHANRAGPGSWASSTPRAGDRLDHG